MPRSLLKRICPSDGGLQGHWFLRRFGHITPGTPAHAEAMATKADLIASLSEPEPTTES